MREFLMPIKAVQHLIEEVSVQYVSETKRPGDCNLIERIKIKGIDLVFERRSWSDGCMRGPKGVGFPKYILFWTSSCMAHLPQEIQDQAICTKYLIEGDRGYHADYLEGVVTD